MWINRPLTRASRIMLPTYVITNAVFGLVFIFDPGRRLKRAPSLSYARDVLPIEAWGWMFLALGTVVLMGLLWPRAKRGAELGLAINGVAWIVWAVVVEKAVSGTPNVSYLAGALPLFVAVASFASLASLLWNETDHVPR